MSIKKQLSQVERQSYQDEKVEIEFKMKLFRKVQKQFGLPLPAGANIDEAVKQFRAAIAANTPEAFEQFRQWVIDEKIKVASK